MYCEVKVSGPVKMSPKSKTGVSLTLEKNFNIYSIFNKRIESFKRFLGFV